MKVTVRFLRHGGICRPMCSRFKSLDRSTAFRPGSAQTVKDAPEVLRPTHRRDEFRPAIPQRVARQQSPPPLHRHAHPKAVPGSATMNLQRTVNSVLTVCLSPRDHPNMGIVEARFCLNIEGRPNLSRLSRGRKRAYGHRTSRDEGRPQPRRAV
jgi:hypothetical protein